jgi:hypothetical protein
MHFINSFFFFAYKIIFSSILPHNIRLARGSYYGISAIIVWGIVSVYVIWLTIMQPSCSRKKSLNEETDISTVVMDVEEASL